MARDSWTSYRQRSECPDEVKIPDIAGNNTLTLSDSGDAFTGFTFTGRRLSSVQKSMELTIDQE
jgi:hypothetical protein